MQNLYFKFGLFQHVVMHIVKVHQLPESVLITDCNGRKVKRLIVVDFHVYSDWSGIKVANSVHYLQDDTSEASKNEDQPHQPEKENTAHHFIPVNICVIFLYVEN